MKYRRKFILNDTPCSILWEGTVDDRSYGWNYNLAMLWVEKQIEK